MEWCGWRQYGIDQHVAEPLVRSRGIVIGNPLFNDAPQMTLTENDKVIETLSLGPAHPRFRVRIQIWTSRRNGPKVDAVGFQDRAELIGELGVSIADDVRRLELGCLFAKIMLMFRAASAIQSPSGFGVMPAMWMPFAAPPEWPRCGRAEQEQGEISRRRSTSDQNGLLILTRPIVPSTLISYKEPIDKSKNSRRNAHIFGETCQGFCIGTASRSLVEFVFVHDVAVIRVRA